MIAIIAALPREIALLVRGTSPDAALLRRGIHLYRLPKAVVVAAGMGAARVSLGVEAALSAGVIGELISVGLAGSCMDSLRAGTLVSCSQIFDTHTGETFETDWPVGEYYNLATTDTIASVREKARLGESYNAALVDMEAATVARLARAHGLKLRVIKAISDDHDFELASLAQFTGPQGSFRTSAFALHTALRPWTWGKAITLGRNSSTALNALHERLVAVIAAQPD